MSRAPKGASTRTVCVSSFMPVIVAGIPMTSSRFRILAPMIFPRPTFSQPLTNDIMVVTSSGREVPSAMAVTAITLSGTPR